MTTWLTDEMRAHMDRVKRTAYLETAVELFIIELLRNGGPDTLDRERARQFAQTLARHGDVLIEPVTKRKAQEPATRVAAGDLARYLAVLAFEPGGVTFEGLHFEEALATPEEALASEQDFKQTILALIEEDQRDRRKA